MATVNREKIRVFAPASIGNVSCGFDVLGCALEAPGDEVVLERCDQPGLQITTISGDDGQLPTEPERNTATVALQALLRFLKVKQGFALELHKKMPIKSGLGSSAASAAAAVFAANELLGRPLPRRELVRFAMEGERVASGTAHADNVAPSLLGGFVLIRSYAPLDIIPLGAPSKLVCTIFHPNIEISTLDARKILREEVLLKDAVRQWGNVAGLVTGILREDYDLIGRSLEDVIVEPVRSVLIPGLDAAKQAAKDAGALGAGISGAGPSLFAFSTSSETARAAGEAMEQVFHQLGIDGHIYISRVNADGPKILE